VGGRASKYVVDDDERQALQAEGFDPDDPAVIAAIINSRIFTGPPPAQSQSQRPEEWMPACALRSP
jgi:hypothetical protein